MAYELTSFERAMAVHAMTLGFESGQAEVYTDDEVEYPIDPEQWSIRSFDVGSNDGEPFADVTATYDTTVTGKQTAAKTRRHPPEYETHDVTVELRVRFWPSRNNGFGETEVVIEQDGGAPSGPSRDFDGYDL